jgi:hypothetical protein
VVINGLTAAQILGLPGAFAGATSFGGTAVVMVTNGVTIFIFDTTASASLSGGFGGNKTGVYAGGSTGDTNLDLVLSIDEEDSSPAIITLNNLTAGNLYSAQLFAINDTAGSLRQISFASSTDPADVSGAFQMGDNVYVLGTFIATGSTQAIAQNEADGHGYMSCVIVRHLLVPPSPIIQKSGSNLQVNWQIGSLLQATNLTGPWLTNTDPAPITIAPAAPRQFFRVQVPIQVP